MTLTDARLLERPGAATAMTLGFVVALWALCHPYVGVYNDANIYIGRVLADLDPHGLGRDLMFANDGQSKFSLFHLLVRPFVAALGVSTAGMIIAALGSLCWLAALIGLTHSLSAGRRAWAMVVAVALLPVAYGNTGVFTFGETAALPRPFAEAAVMMALAGAVRGHIRTAVAASIGAALVHPIMALPGIGAVILTVIMRAPARQGRVFIAVLVLGVGSAVTLAWLGAPLFNRLLAVADPTWLGMLANRSPYLFVTQWDADAVPLIIAQSATIGVAAHLSPPPQRRFYLAVLIAGAFGFVAAAVLADAFHLLLFIQVQSWRVTWLIGVTGGCALAACTMELWHRDSAGRITLGLLGLAWFFQPHPLVSLAVVSLAFMIHFGLLLDKSRLNDRHVAAVYAVAGICAANWWLGAVVGYIDFSRSNASLSGVDFLRNNLHTLPLCMLAAYWFVSDRPSNPDLQNRIAAGATGVLVVAAAMCWDQRSKADAYFMAPAAPPGFAALAADRAPEVLWLDSRAETWFMLGRPQYLSSQQAVSIVFSRPLAMEWRRRADLLVGLNLARKSIYTPFGEAAIDDRVHVRQAALDTLCHQPDAPGTVVIPLEDLDPAKPPAGMILWHVPYPRQSYEKFAPEGAHMVLTSTFGIVPCAPRALHGSTFPQ